MATTAAPYGLRPVNLIGGRPYAGAVRHIKIASGYAANIYNGSVVKIVADGVIEIVLDDGSAADPFVAGTVGVFVGCSYTNSDGQYINRNYWPTGTIASDAKAHVVDDPNALFMIQADGAVPQTALGANSHLAAVQSTSTGSTVTGNSTSALSASNVATTDGDCFRIIDFVESSTSTVGDAYTDVIVKFNHIAHSYTNPTGI